MTRGGGDNDSLNLECAVTVNPIVLPSYICRPTLPNNITPYDTAIADTGDSRVYLTPKARCAKIDPAAHQLVVGTADGPPHRSSASCDVNLPIPFTKGHLMPNFHQNLMGIGPLYDHGCCVLFEKYQLLFFQRRHHHTTWLA